jgi:hypothetical protein
MNVYAFIPNGAEWEDIEYYTDYKLLEERLLKYSHRKGYPAGFGMMYSAGNDGRLYEMFSYHINENYEIYKTTATNAPTLSQLLSESSHQ